MKGFETMKEKSKSRKGLKITAVILQLLGLDLFFDDKVCVFQLPLEQYGFDLATKGFVRASHRNNMAVHYWTVNDKEEMLHLIDIGADGIMTDYPTRLKTVYEEYLNNK